MNWELENNGMAQCWICDKEIQLNKMPYCKDCLKKNKSKLDKWF